MGIPYVGPTPANPGDLATKGMVDAVIPVITTEAALDSVVNSGFYYCLIDNATNWPTLFSMTGGSVTKVPMSVRRLDDGGYVSVTQTLMFGASYGYLERFFEPGGYSGPWEYFVQVKNNGANNQVFGLDQYGAIGFMDPSFVTLSNFSDLNNVSSTKTVTGYVNVYELGSQSGISSLGIISDSTARFTSHVAINWSTTYVYQHQTVTVNTFDGKLVTISRTRSGSGYGAGYGAWSAWAIVDQEPRLGGLTFVKLTQAAYTALSTKDPNTVYLIVG